MAEDGAPLRECFKRTRHWRVAVDFNSSLVGWLILTPLRHVETLAELSDTEAAELETVLREASMALQVVTGCIKTYVMLFAEADGFAHLHFHVVARMPDLPDELRGPKVFGLLNGTAVSEKRRDELAVHLIDAWPSGCSAPPS